MKSTFLNYLPLAGLAAVALNSCGTGGPGHSDYLTGVGGTIHQQTSSGSNHPAPAIPDELKV